MYRSLYFPPAVIFVIIVLASLFAWQGAKTTLNRDISLEANAKADSAERALRDHTAAYEQILRGGAGLFQSSDVVTAEEWESFLNVYDLNQGFIGVQGIGFVEEFNAKDLRAVTRFAKNQGITNFKLTPAEPARDKYATIIYLHVVGDSKNPPPGYDMYSDPDRLETMSSAKSSGQISMTPPIELMPTDPSSNRLGFVMFAPFYNRKMPDGTEAERQASLDGYIYISFCDHTFFRNIMGKADNGRTGFNATTTVNGKQVELYKSPSYDKIIQKSDAGLSKRQVQLYGQTWTINLASDSKALVSNEQLSRPEAVLFFGVFSAMLIAAIVLLLLRVRARDLSTQKDKAVELAKDELLSLASHQLRTPATGVKQYVGMVLQGFAGKLSASQKNLLEKAYASNDRQLRIINEILHLAKIESGRIVLAKQRTNLNDLVNDILNEQRADIEAAEHQAEAVLPNRPVTIDADTHMLRMAIENLLSNAIKYTPKGGKITINVSKDGSHAYVKVADTGVGIRPADSKKIFRQFSRLSNIMSQQVGGTGIGLYLAKHLVELHGGSINFESRPGKGSTFTIAMPLPGDP